MPTNLTPIIRKRKRPMVTEIPEDLLRWLRVGPINFWRPKDERPSDLYGWVVYFSSADESLAWLSEAWLKHEAFIRQGVDGDPFILEEMQRLRKFIEAGRKWQGE
mgnify:CR=1 FL=1